MGLELQRGTVLGAYELLVRIGRGGMASVWVARGRVHPSEPEKLLAIKAMLPDLAQNMEFRSMFLDEGQIVGSIDHPNVVKVHEVGEADGILFMVMEWVEGDSLHALIAEANKRRPIPPEVAVRMIADTASGLHAAHELRGWDGELREIVHCDVSPHNILIGLDGGVKLVDFGVAGAMNQLTSDDEAKIRGKFGYMSPEQAQAKTLDRRSDVFSLGIVLFELTTGYRLFRGRDDRHTLDLVTFGKIPRPSQVVPSYPPKLETIVLKALERDLDRRYQTADEVRDALETYLVEERILVPSAGVKGLLRRVLGSRIEQRRQQVRSSIRALDGSQPGAALVSEDAVLLDDDAVSVSVSQVESQNDFASVSGLGAARLPSDSSASAAHSLSQPAQAPAQRRSPMGGFLTGTLVGIAAAVAIFFFLSNRKTEPEVTEHAQKTQSTAGSGAESEEKTEAAQEARAEIRRQKQEEKLGFSIESLPQDTDGTTTSITGAEGTAGGPSPGEGDRGLTAEERLERDMEAIKDKDKDKESSPKVVLEEDPVDVAAERVTLDESGSATPKPGSFDQAAAARALGNAAFQAKLCRRPGGQTGTGKVFVSVAPSGRVQNVEVVGKFAGTPVGECVAQKFRRLKIPSFNGGSKRLGKSFTIPD